MGNTSPPSSPFWWPLDLPTHLDNYFQQFRRQMLEAPISLNTEAVDLVSDLLGQMMRQHITFLVERDSLPHLNHILNGWGNVDFQGAALTSRLENFIHFDGEGRPFIKQCDPEGEVHPWQTFAYAIMAGVDPDIAIRPGISLRDLAQNSRYLHTREGRELGHLLFTLAYLDTNCDAEPFSLLGEECNIRRLMELAIEAHHHGTFEVCRKFHLTEGVCAMAVKVKGLEDFRADAQGFLEGQLDMLLLLGGILQNARELMAEGQRAESGSLIDELRDTLVIGPYLENHCYYAGHLIELGAFADSLGYNILPEHRSAMAFVANQLNQTLPAFLPFTSFPDCFLHVGHYRRAITLLKEMKHVRNKGLELSPTDLSRFSLVLQDHDPEAEAMLESAAQQPSPIANGIYALAVSEENPRPAFLEVSHHYRSIAPPQFAPRGNREHYRRVIPLGWPRAFHYELLDYGGTIGAEIHIENAELAWLREHVHSLLNQVAAYFPDKQVDWEPEWEGIGRLRVLFEPEVPVEGVAAGMLTLIEKTHAELNAALHARGDTAGGVSH